MIRKISLLLGIVLGFAMLPNAIASAQDTPPLNAGHPVPNFKAQTLKGPVVSRHSLLGHVYLVDFWATWCDPCRDSMPMLQGMYKKYSSRGFKVLGLSIDLPISFPKVKPLLAKMHISYPVATAPDSFSALGDSFNCQGAVPALYLVDRHGIVRWSTLGYNRSEAMDLDHLISKLLRQK